MPLQKIPWLPITVIGLVFLFGSPLESAAAKDGFPVHDDLFSISFPTERDGWACGRFGTILRTSDGGATWTRQTSGTTFTLSSIYFTDTQNGWAVGNGGTILHTRDGGLKWEPQQSPVEQFHMGVLFLTPEKGFIVSERTHILGTLDGGSTWSVVFQDEDYILKGLSFCDAQNGWAVGEFGYIYHTGDGGEHWEKQAGFFELDPETGDIRGEEFLFDVAAIDPLTVLAVGIQGIVKMSQDGGKTWQGVEIGSPTVPLYRIRAAPDGSILIGGKGVSFLSRDRGRTWQAARFEPPIVYNWIYGISPLGAHGFAACGDEGAIYLNPGEENLWKRIRY
jgi:photosystem II stability/assembly factor-like uncharacterized protein